MAATAGFINSLLDAGFRGQTYAGGIITLALYTDGLPSGGGVEVTGGGYGRQTLTFATASNKTIVTSTNVTFTDLPTNKTIVAYGVYSGTTLIDEKMLATPFQPELTSNELSVSYKFEFGA